MLIQTQVCDAHDFFSVLFDFSYYTLPAVHEKRIQIGYHSKLLYEKTMLENCLAW